MIYSPLHAFPMQQMFLRERLITVQSTTSCLMSTANTKVTSLVGNYEYATEEGPYIL